MRMILEKLPKGWKRLYLCRHGETEANAKNIIQGSGVDHELNEIGVRQAEKLGDLLSSIPLDVVHTSLLARSIKTAHIIRERNLQICANERDSMRSHSGLNEMYYGEWEGRAIESVLNDIRAISMEWAAGKIGIKCPGNGESPEEVLERVNQCLLHRILGPEKELNVHNTQHVCIVAHSRLNQILISHLSGKGLIHMREFQQGNCCVNVIDFDPFEGKFHLRLLNYRDHVNGKL